jgi:hypothetical protein
MAKFTIEFFKQSSIIPEKTEGGFWKDFESAERYADSRRFEIGCCSYEVKEK